MGLIKFMLIGVSFLILMASDRQEELGKNEDVVEDYETTMQRVLNDCLVNPSFSCNIEEHAVSDLIQYIENNPGRFSYQDTQTITKNRELRKTFLDEAEQILYENDKEVLLW
ncbi:hypothetical protein [Bacillus solitudinis]|uniref:hypothetical protein n=1 Tax=Bacillus solitudinis TaxID=2014074 RepID=UPI000C25020D|nr:hypothetical protein [Bacillus solitudinis]